MTDRLQKEKKKILTLRVKNNIENGEWQKLIDALPVAEEAGIDKKLIRKSYLVLGDQFRSKKPFSDAIIFYTKALNITDNESLYLKLAGSIKLFINLFETSFCKLDLQRIENYLIFLTKKVKLLLPSNYALLNELNSILSNVRKLELSATLDLSESSATIHIDKIINSSYNPKSPKEVFERSSEIILDWIQPFYDEESKKESGIKKKKKKTKKKKKAEDD